MMFGNQIRRNAREGHKAGDKFLFLSLLSGFLLVDNIRNQPSRHSSYSSNKSLKEMEEEIAEFEKRWAKPFKYRQTIVLYSILIVIAFAMPFLGVYLYSWADWWMFFCVLLSGVIELLCLLPLSLLNDKIKSGWKFDPHNVDMTIKQIRIIIWYSITGVTIAALLSCYPFIIPHYKENLLVILLVAFILIIHIGYLCELIGAVKNVDKSIKSNISRYNN